MDKKPTRGILEYFVDMIALPETLLNVFDPLHVLDRCYE